MKLCRICNEEPEVMDGLCETCLCYRFGVSAIEFNEQQRASDFERKLTITLLGLALLCVGLFSVWRIFQ